MLELPPAIVVASRLADLVEAVWPWTLLFLLGWVATSEGRAMAARRRILARPGLLVPAVMGVGGLVLLHVSAGRFGVFDTPPMFVGNGFRPSLWFDNPMTPYWVGLAIVATTLAGHVGILEGQREGRRPNGYDFLAGIRRHTLTFALGKIVLFAGIQTVFWLAPMRGPALLLLLVPNVLLAPLVGMATLHPGRPIAALFATVRHGVEHIQTVGFRVTLLTGFVIGALYAASKIVGADPIEPALGKMASTLSWNPYPWLNATWWSVPIVILGIGVVFVSTVMLTAQWIAVVEPQTAGTKERGAPAVSP